MRLHLDTSALKDLRRFGLNDNEYERIATSE